MTSKPTRPTVLDQEKLLALIDSVEAGPEIIGSENELWDLDTFRDLLALQFGIFMHPDDARWSKSNDKTC